VPSRFVVWVEHEQLAMEPYGHSTRMREVVKYPNIRWSVIVALAALSDADYQQRAWLGARTAASDDWDNLDEVIHTLFDDTMVCEAQFENEIGLILVSGREGGLLLRLGATLGGLIDRLGDGPDDVYLQDPSWPDVCRQAGQALAAMVLANGGNVLLNSLSNDVIVAPQAEVGEESISNDGYIDVSPGDA